MRTFRRKRRPCIHVRRRMGSLSLFAELTFKVAGEDGVYRHGMNVIGFAMVRISFGMDMEQGQGEQPEHDPPPQDAVGSDWSAVNSSHNRTVL